MFKVLRQFRNAIKYSIDGLVFLVQNEFAARLEFYGLAWALLLFFYIDVSLHDTVMALVLFCILVAAEALNTAIEVMIDRISPEISKTGKHAKDLGSFAVMCVMIANLIFVGYILWSADFGAAFARLRANPALLICAIALILIGIYWFARLVKRSAMRKKSSGSNQ